MRFTGYLLLILPKFTSSLSTLGSCMIISQVLMSKKNRNNQQQRIVCAMSIIDVLVSSVWFLTNLFIPSNTEGFPGAIGNKATCAAQGFIVQFSISSVIYNAALSYYYLLVVKYNYKSPQMRKVEKWIHITPITFGLVTAVFALSFDLYNFADWDCWIMSDPADSLAKQQLAKILQFAFFFGPVWCAIIFAAINMIQVFFNVRRREKQSSEWLRKRAESEQKRQQEEISNRTLRTGNIDTPALQASVNDSEYDAARSTRDGVIDVPLNLSDADYSEPVHSLCKISSLRNSSSYHEAHKTRKYYDDSCSSAGDGPCCEELQNSSLAPREEASGSSVQTPITMKCTRLVAKQGILYVGAFIITWIFPSISRIYFISSGRTIPEPLRVLSGFFIPSQGFFNALVYFRLRFIRCGAKYPHKSKLWVVRRIIRLTLFPCTEKIDQRYNIDDGNDVERISHDEDGSVPRSRSSVGHSFGNRKSLSEGNVASNEVRSRISNQSVGVSYPSFQSNLSSELSCFVSETEQEKSNAEIEADMDPATAAQKIARVVRPASVNDTSFYVKAREMVRDTIAAPTDGIQQTGKTGTENIPRRSYRDILNSRKNLKASAEQAPVESDDISSSRSLERMSDFLSTIEEAEDAE